VCWAFRSQHRDEWQSADEILLLMGKRFTVEQNCGRMLNVGLVQYVFFASHTNEIIYYQHDANSMGCDLLFLCTTVRRATEKRQIPHFVTCVNNYCTFEVVQEF